MNRRKFSHRAIQFLPLIKNNCSFTHSFYCSEQDSKLLHSPTVQNDTASNNSISSDRALPPLPITPFRVTTFHVTLSLRSYFYLNYFKRNNYGSIFFHHTGLHMYDYVLSQYKTPLTVHPTQWKPERL